MESEPCRESQRFPFRLPGTAVACFVLALALAGPAPLPAQDGDPGSPGEDPLASDAATLEGLLFDEPLLEGSDGLTLDPTLTDPGGGSGTIVVAVETEPTGSGGSFAFTGVPTCDYLDADGEPFEPGTEGKVAEGVEPCVPAGGTLATPNLEPGTYTTTQVDPAPGFDITDVRCDDGDSPTTSSGDPATRSAVFQVDPGETVTCTFVNTRRGAAAGSDDPVVLAYLPFDAGLPVESARGLETEVFAFGAGGVRSVEGRYGSAALFEGGSGILFPLDLDFATHRTISVSLWVRVTREGAGERGFLFSTGKAADHTPGLSLLGSKVVADAVGQRLIGYGRELDVGEWVHVAGVWDSDARSVQLFTGESEHTRTGLDAMDPTVIADRGRSHSVLDHPVDERRDPARWVTLGALSLNGFRPIEDVALDEVRIYAGALTAADIAAIRDAETPPALGRVAPPPPEPEPEDEEPTAEDRGAGADAPARELVGWTLADDYELSDVSGSAGDRRERLDYESRTLDVIEIHESSDRPCMVRIYTDGYSSPREMEGSGCGRFGSGGYVDVDLGRGFHLNSLQACQNDRSNERVKGLRVWGRRIEVDAEAGEIDFREPNADEDALANCRKWTEVVSCDSGQLASGLYAHFTDVGRWDREQIVGLQLVCRDVVGKYD